MVGAVAAKVGVALVPRPVGRAGRLNDPLPVAPGPPDQAHVPVGRAEEAVRVRPAALRRAAALTTPWNPVRLVHECVDPSERRQHLGGRDRERAGQTRLQQRQAGGRRNESRRIASDLERRLDGFAIRSAARGGHARAGGGRQPARRLERVERLGEGDRGDAGGHRELGVVDHEVRARAVPAGGGSVPHGSHRDSGVKPGGEPPFPFADCGRRRRVEPGRCDPFHRRSQAGKRAPGEPGGS